jgi:hypothetical protein
MKKIAMIAGALMLALQVNAPTASAHHPSCTLRCTPSVAAQMQAEARAKHIHKIKKHHIRKHKAHGSLHVRIRKAIGHAYSEGYHDGYRDGVHARRGHYHGRAHRKWVRLPRGKSYHHGHYWYD